MTKYIDVITTWLTAPLLAGLFAGCAFGYDMSVESRHHAWVNGMRSQIGKGNMYDCRYWICTQRFESGVFLGDTTLLNGNVEAGYSRWEGRCRLFFEYDPKSGVIVSFRFEESERFACRISGA